MDPKLIAPLITAALVAWILYRRLGRLFGRQAVNATRLKVRSAMLCAVAVLLLWALGRDLALVGVLLAGVAAGIVLGYVGLRHTQFEATAEGRFYTPHTYVGLGVTALVLGRVAYRFFTLYTSGELAQPSQDPFAQFHQSPLTLVLFGLLIGYYVTFNVGVLRKSGKQTTAVPVAPP